LTFKDLKKRVTLQTTQESATIERLCNKPFWIWLREHHKQEDIRTDGDCCFNHIMGLPHKDGEDKPLYDYEKILYDALLVDVDESHNQLNHVGFIHNLTYIYKGRP
jgi:hypothetical protein